MSSRTRLIVVSITAPVIAFAIVGGLLSKVMAREDTYQHLKVFEDVVNLITNSYVESVNVDKVMRGAMQGLADALDAESTYLTSDEVKQVEAGTPLPDGDVGLELTRQYYLRIIAARDNSPAARAGLRTGDFVRAINDVPTREMAVWQGFRSLRGAPGTKVTLTVFRGNTLDPHIVELTREALQPLDVTGRIVSPGIGYVRIPSLGPRTVDQVKAQIGELTKNGAAQLIVDVRRTATGTYEQGLALARLFVASGTLAMREAKGAPPESIGAASGDGSITLPMVLLIDNGTAGPTELLASALAGNKRATLIGERTIGRAGVQKLIKLPDGSGLWLTTTRYLTPDGKPLHEKGLEPTVAVDSPEVEFGQAPPATDPALDRALERLTERLAEKKAA